MSRLFIMLTRLVLSAIVLTSAVPAMAQVGRIPPNAIDRATAVDDARRAAIADAATADRERATRDARDSAARVGPVQQSTMTDRVSGLNGALAPATTASTAPSPATPN
ncbi:hypothetical protein M0208_05870 [Sphingomonas sp. SUN019]|uniref:hypothetical protein n=1 Tax=Sphingomonas sp. SUN019 TaxID=2937788 RepID=UPI0021644AA0|nr:hypothetical protein [Sphingomonas sp. SUN019]UVO50069.1 hypothetical protein M0208_05870 [Sphingomonas sp. SUN019]